MPHAWSLAAPAQVGPGAERSRAAGRLAEAGSIPPCAHCQGISSPASSNRTSRGRTSTFSRVGTPSDTFQSSQKPWQKIGPCPQRPGAGGGEPCSPAALAVCRGRQRLGGSPCCSMWHLRVLRVPQGLSSTSLLGAWPEPRRFVHCLQGSRAGG